MKRRTLVKCEACGAERLVFINHHRGEPKLCIACSNRHRAGIEDIGEPSGAGTRLYRMWMDMRKRSGRVRGAGQRVSHSYVGRGIGLVQEWADSFWAFHGWAMANGFKDGLTLDRIDNDAGYGPGNCQFVGMKEQARNRRSTKLTPDMVGMIRERLGQGLPQLEIAEEFGISFSHVSRIKLGRAWSDIGQQQTPDFKA